MAILTGRYGKVAFEASPTSPISANEIVSINTWKLSLKTDYTDVTCFNDGNKVYVPGLRDVSGSFGGFWNSSELTLIHGSSLATPGYLELTPNRNEGAFVFGGLAYLDADLDCTLSRTAMSGTFKAAGTWVTP